MGWNIEVFKEKIEKEHPFPGTYVFKFIVPSSSKEEIIEILPEGNMSFRNSSNNKYISITLVAVMKNSDDVIRVYKDANVIKGIVAL